MRRTTVTVLSVTAALALASCSGSDTTTKTDTKAKPKASISAAPQKLEPVWGPKLEAAAGKESEATAACQQPSSNACARYAGDIMSVVAGLEAAIRETGREYPATLEQIGNMKDAEAEYEANGCQGDVTAEDPNSLCHGIVGVTVGAFTLSMTLPTDEVSL